MKDDDVNTSSPSVFPGDSILIDALKNTPTHEGLQDSVYVGKLVAACLALVPDATAEEIAYFIRPKTHLRYHHTLGGLLLTAVPNALRGGIAALRAARTAKLAAERGRDMERNTELQCILDAPWVPADEKQLAKIALGIDQGD